MGIWVGYQKDSTLNWSKNAREVDVQKLRVMILLRPQENERSFLAVKYKTF